MNFLYIIFGTFLCTLTLAAAAEQADLLPTSTSSPTSVIKKTRKRPPPLNYFPSFDNQGIKPSFRTITPPPSPVVITAEPQTLSLNPEECFCPQCWSPDFPQRQHKWVQTGLAQLMEENTTYQDFDQWALSIWENIDNTSRFIITDSMFRKWKAQIGDTMQLAPEWIAEFLDPYSNDINQLLENRIRANEILGEISKISKKFAMEDLGGALPSSEVPQSVTASAATHTNFTTPIPQPHPVRQPSIYSYTLETAYTAVVEMEKLSKQTRARDQYALQTLLNIAENQAVDLNIRAAAYIVLGNGKYGTDMGAECYEKALKLNPSKIIKAKAHLGLAKAHISVVVNCQTAIILAIENKAITEHAYIAWGNALASPDYDNNNIQALLMYFKAKEASYRSVKARSYYILQDLKLYDSYCSTGEAGFSKNTSHAAKKINQLNLSPQDAAELLQARQFFQM